MKKMLFSAIAMVAFATSGFANNGDGDKTTTSKQQLEKSASEMEDEALYCEVETANGGSVSCWVCDCNELAKTVSKGGSNGSGNENQSEVGLGRP